MTKGCAAFHIVGMAYRCGCTGLESSSADDCGPEAGMDGNADPEVLWQCRHCRVTVETGQKLSLHDNDHSSPWAMTFLRIICMKLIYYFVRRMAQLEHLSKKKKKKISIPLRVPGSFLAA